MDVAAAPAGEKFEWYENDGNQNFTTHSISESPSSCQSIYVVDVDNDGDLDILTATFGANMVGWLENDGNQNFTIHVITTSARQADTVWGSDVDGDGDIDILSAALGGDQIAWYESNLNDPVSVENNETIPLQFSLHQNYPNPFNPSTNISYDLLHAVDVRLVIYDILGHEVKAIADGLKPAGQHQIIVDMSGLSSGVYFYRLQAKSFNEMRKMIYLR